MGLKKACIFPTGSLDCIGLSPLLEQSLFSSEVRIKSDSKIKTETPKDRSFRPWFHLAPEAIKPNAQPCLGILQDVPLQILSPQSNIANIANTTNTINKHRNMQWPARPHSQGRCVRRR
jgi:hypothetical protein